MTSPEIPAPGPMVPSSPSRPEVPSPGPPSSPTHPSDVPREPREEPRAPREEPRIPREVPGERPREEPRTPREVPDGPDEVPPHVPSPRRDLPPGPSRPEVPPQNPPSKPPAPGRPPTPGAPSGPRPDAPSPAPAPPSTDPASPSPGPSTQGEAQVVVVRPQDAGKPLEKLLGRRLVGATWPQIGRLIRTKRVLVDGVIGARGQLVQAGQKVVVQPGPARAAAPPQPNKRLHLTIVHEDPHLAVVLKPAGRPVHPGPGHGTDTMLNGFVARWPELVELGLERGHGLVHRLDLDTSGLLIVARTAQAYDGLVAAFAGREVEKEYLAMVRGRCLPSGVVDEPVEDKPARTRFETLETVQGERGSASLVRAFPETGRTHQIRIHLASLGHPVLHDRRHGDGVRPADEPVGVPRLALHAHRLTFTHPVTGARLAFEAPLPRDLRRAWKKAGGKVLLGADEADEPVP
jgi:23S rRNA pseudouridine1911/1915/1917 synthase